MELCKTEVQIAKRGFTDVQDSLHSFKVVRECAKCGQVKEITEFYLTGQEGKKYRTKVCKVCERKKKRETFKAVNKDCKTYALEPSESCTIACGQVQKHLIEGISDGFVPGIIDRHKAEIDGFVHIHSQDSVDEMRRLARTHGIFVGPSSGAHMLAAKQLKQELKLETVVTMFCDEGEKYMKDYWLKF